MSEKSVFNAGKNSVDSPAVGYRRNGIAGAALVIINFLAYLRALTGKFIWDDDDNVTANATLRSLHGLRRIWFEPGATQQYYPLTHTSFWLDYHAWGLHPLGYHFVNIALHALSALLVWRLLRYLRVPGAWLGAAFFALHPVMVESVAWITERKNTLSAVFFLASLLMSLKFWLPEQSHKNPSASAADGLGLRRFYFLAGLFYLGALWSKTAVIGLPLVILLLLWWRRRAVQMRDFLLLIPFALAGLIFGSITIWVENTHVGAVGADWNLSLLQRGLLAGRIFWFYLGKIIWPQPLMFLYPRWSIQSANPLAYLPLLAALIALVVFWRKRNSWGRPLLFTFGYFLALLFPVLGFFNVFFFRYSFVCDHFQYVAAIAPLALVAALLTRFFHRWGKPVALLPPAMLLLILGSLTWRQIAIYHDRETLWRDCIRHNPNAWLAFNNLGNELSQRNDLAGAMENYRSALRAKPDYALAHNNLGDALLKQGQVNDSLLCFKTALQIDPGFAEAHNNLGDAFRRLNRNTDAIYEFQKAVELKPGYAEAHYNLANALAQNGRNDEAILQFQEALKLAPDFAAAENNLGDVYLKKGNPGAAAAYYQHAIALNPDYAEAHYNLGNLLLETGRPGEAISQFQDALRINPNFSAAHYNLANAFRQTGNLDEAIIHFQKTIALRPDFSAAHNNLGNALFKQGDLAGAIIQFQQALQLDPGFAEAHNNLGSALLQQSAVAEAIVQFQAALSLQPGYAEAHYNLGNALLRNHELDAALLQYQAALEKKPDFAEAHYNRSSVFYQKGFLPEAVSEYQQAVKLKPLLGKNDQLGNALLKAVAKNGLRPVPPTQSPPN